MKGHLTSTALHWRYNERHGVLNHQHIDCLVSRLFRHTWSKTSKLRVTGFVKGIHRWPVDSPHKGTITRKMGPFDDVIMGPKFFVRVSGWNHVGGRLVLKTLYKTRWTNALSAPPERKLLKNRHKVPNGFWLLQWRFQTVWTLISFRQPIKVCGVFIGMFLSKVLKPYDKHKRSIKWSVGACNKFCQQYISEPILFCNISRDISNGFFLYSGYINSS